MFTWLKKLFAPAPLPTATLYGTEYHIAKNTAQLSQGLSEGKKMMFRLNITKYMSETKSLINYLVRTHGQSSPEVNAVVNAPLVCPKCNTLFPDSWKLRAGFGSGGGTCPKCQNEEALLILLVYRPEDITEADVAALGAYWRSKGEDPGKVEFRLRNGLQELKKYPYYFGMMELWLARNHVSQQAPESVTPNDAELEAIFIKLMAQATMESVFMDRTSGKQRSERERYNSVMSQVHTGLNKTLPRPLSNEEFTSLMNRATSKGT